MTFTALDPLPNLAAPAGSRYRTKIAPSPLADAQFECGVMFITEFVLRVRYRFMRIKNEPSLIYWQFFDFGRRFERLTT
jgi:hypothetical protein